MQGNFDLIVGDGLRRIRSEDSGVQRKFIDNVARARGMDFGVLWETGAVFIPNDDYLAV